MITQQAHGIHTANGQMTLEFPRNMQGTAMQNSATETRFSVDDILRSGDEHMYVKSIFRLKRFKELKDGVIDTYLKNYADSRAGSKAAEYLACTHRTLWTTSLTTSVIKER